MSYQLETRIVERGNKPVWQRAKDTVRSLWSGPFSVKDRALSSRMFSYSASAAGVRVNDTTLLYLSAVWDGVGRLAGDIGSFPWHVYSRTPDGDRTKRRDHYLAPLLNLEAAPNVSAQAWRERLMQDALIHGNGFSLILRDEDGRPGRLLHVDPWRMGWEKDGSDLSYRLDGDKRIPARDVFHVHGPHLRDSVMGLGLLDVAHESVAIGLAAQRFSGSFFANGATAQVLSTDSPMGDLAQKNLLESINQRTTGDRAHGTLILTGGPWKLDRLGANPAESQLTETRLFVVQEVARWLGVPPMVLGDYGRATWANSTEMRREYFDSALRHWLTRFEAEAQLKLVNYFERNVVYTRLNADAILRANTTERYAAYEVGIRSGFLSPNDCRRLEDMEEIPGGDTYATAQVD